MVRKVKRGRRRVASRLMKQPVAERLIKEMQGPVAVYIDAANLEKSVQILGPIAV